MIYDSSFINRGCFRPMREATSAIKSLSIVCLAINDIHLFICLNNIQHFINSGIFCSKTFSSRS